MLQNLPPHTPLRRRALLLRSLGLASSAMLVAACSGVELPSQSPPVAQPTGPRRGGGLRISQSSDIAPPGMPHLINPFNFVLYPLVYDTLLAYDAQLQPRPRLATSWQWSADARQITLQLRQGVKFHSGGPLTSVEIKTNLEHLRDPTVGSQWMSYANQMQIDASDPATLVINFDAPSKSSLDALASTFIADPATLDSTKFVGTGPFRFREWIQGDHLTFDRNPDYWQPGKPYVDEVVLQVQPDLQSSLIGLESGSLDWLRNVAGNDARRLQADPTYQVLETGSGGNSFVVVMLDTSVPALADRRVRQAFSYAVNRQRMVDSALAGYGRPASTCWPPQALGYDASQDHMYSYDLDQARQLLQTVGWDPQTRVPLLVASEFPATIAMAEIYQADLQQIGINAAMEIKSGAETLNLLRKKLVGGAMFSPMGSMNLSPATFFTSNIYARVPNPSNFTSTQYTDLIAQTLTATDDQQLKRVVHDLTQLMLDEAFLIPIAETLGGADGPGVARANLKNIGWNNYGMYAFEDVWVEQ